MNPSKHKAPFGMKSGKRTALTVKWWTLLSAILRSQLSNGWKLPLVWKRHCRRLDRLCNRSLTYSRRRHQQLRVLRELNGDAYRLATSKWIHERRDRRTWGRDRHLGRKLPHRWLGNELLLHSTEWFEQSLLGSSGRRPNVIWPQHPLQPRFYVGRYNQLLVLHSNHST